MPGLNFSSGNDVQYRRYRPSGRDNFSLLLTCAILLGASAGLYAATFFH